MTAYLHAGGNAVRIDGAELELLGWLAVRWRDSCALDVRFAESWADSPVPDDVLAGIRRRLADAERFVSTLELVLGSELGTAAPA